MTSAKNHLEDVDLFVTTCEGREHLLPRTIASFEAACNCTFRRRILAIDGAFDPSVTACVRPDVEVRLTRRSGYIASILSAMRHCEAPWFFWLEDDWRFTRALDLSTVRWELARHPRWAQVRVSKCAPLAATESLAPGYVGSTVGFSTNPSLNATAIVRSAFDALRTGPLRHDEGFEVDVSEWLASQGLVCAVLDPGETPPIEHDGYLESTPREWHVTASLQGKAQYVSSLHQRPRLWHRILMVPRLAARCTRVAATQFRDDRMFELAFRMVNVPMPSKGGSESRKPASSAPRPSTTTA